MSCKISPEQVAKQIIAGESGRPGRLAAHIATCPECEAQATLLLETGRLLDGAGQIQPPNDLWESVAVRLAAFPSRRRLSNLRGRLALGFVTVLLAVTVIMQIRPHPGPVDDVTLFYEHHTAISAAAAGPEIPASALKSFDAKIPFAVLQPRALPAGWRLVKLDRFICRRGLPVAQLTYANGSQRLSVFEKPASGGPGAGMGRGRGRSMNNGLGRGGGCGSCSICRVGRAQMALAGSRSMRFFVVGDMPAAELEHIACGLAERN